MMSTLCSEEKVPDNWESLPTESPIKCIKISQDNGTNLVWADAMMDTSYSEKEVPDEEESLSNENPNKVSQVNSNNSQEDASYESLKHEIEACSNNLSMAILQCKENLENSSCKPKLSSVKKELMSLKHEVIQKYDKIYETFATLNEKNCHEKSEIYSHLQSKSLHLFQIEEILKKLHDQENEPKCKKNISKKKKKITKKNQDPILKTDKENEDVPDACDSLPNESNITKCSEVSQVHDSSSQGTQDCSYESLKCEIEAYSTTLSKAILECEGKLENSSTQAKLRSVKKELFALKQEAIQKYSKMHETFSMLNERSSTLKVSASNLQKQQNNLAQMKKHVQKIRSGENLDFYTNNIKEKNNQRGSKVKYFENKIIKDYNIQKNSSSFNKGLKSKLQTIHSHKNTLYKKIRDINAEKAEIYDHLKGKSLHLTHISEILKKLHSLENEHKKENIPKKNKDVRKENQDPILEDI